MLNTEASLQFTIAGWRSPLHIVCPSCSPEHRLWGVRSALDPRGPQRVWPGVKLLLPRAAWSIQTTLKSFAVRLAGWKAPQEMGTLSTTSCINERPHFPVHCLKWSLKSQIDLTLSPLPVAGKEAVISNCRLPPLRHHRCLKYVVPFDHGWEGAETANCATHVHTSGQQKREVGGFDPARFEWSWSRQADTGKVNSSEALALPRPFNPAASCLLSEARV